MQKPSVYAAIVRMNSVFCTGICVSPKGYRKTDTLA
jgi:hypothetical protein